MIKYENRCLAVSGSESQVKAELTSIIKMMYEAGDLSKEDINLTVKLATEPEELLKENPSAPEKLLLIMLAASKREVRRREKSHDQEDLLL